MKKRSKSNSKKRTKKYGNRSKKLSRSYAQYRRYKQKFLAESLPPELNVAVESLDVFWSPNGGCRDILITSLLKAKAHIRIQAYNFTDPLITSVLGSLANTVTIEVILDGYSLSQEQASKLSRMGVKVYVDTQHSSAHNKVCLIDNSVVLTGSYNLTKSAECRNAENLLVIRSTQLTEAYLRNWEHHKDHSKVYYDKQRDSGKVDS